jgi:WD40 repeat protein
MRAWLALVLVLGVACGSPPDRESAPPQPAAGVHDHTPHHGGVVGMSGRLHLEARVAPDGTLRVWVTDFWRSPRSLDDVSGSATLELPAGDRDLALHVDGDALAAAAPGLTDAEVPVHVALTVAGDPVEMDFLLPVAAGAPGSANAPLHGCEPLPPGAGPRCTLDFAKTVSAIAASPDGTTVLVAAVDRGVSARRLPDGALALGFAAPPPITVPGPEGLRPHPEAVTTLAFRPDGGEVAVALEGRLLRYVPATGGLVREVPTPRGVLRAAAWSPDGEGLLVSVFYDAAAHLLRAEDGTELGRFPVEREAAAVAFSSEGRLAAVGSEGGTVLLFDLGAGGAPRALAGARGPAHTLAFVGDRLLGAGDDGVLHVWDVASGKDDPRGTAEGPLAALAVAPGGRDAAVAGPGGMIRLFALAEPRAETRLAWHSSQVLSLAWAGDVLVSGDLEGHVAFWDVSPPRPAGGSGSGR